MAIKMFYAWLLPPGLFMLLLLVINFYKSRGKRNDLLLLVVAALMYFMSVGVFSDNLIKNWKMDMYRQIKVFYMNISVW